MFKVVQVPGKGRGLLATETLPAGCVIERVPAVRLGPEDRTKVDSTALFAYTFADPAEFADGTPESDRDCLLAFGSLTFCNHSERPNAVIRWSADEVGLWASLEALQSILPGEEITLYYTNISEYSASDLFI